MNNDFLKEIQSDFLREAEDLLSTVEGLFLKLEKTPDDMSIYDELARLAHNFKGSGKAVGFDDISTLAHAMEDLLIAIKGRKVSPSSDNIQILLDTIDQLKIDISGLTENPDKVLEHQELLVRLKSPLKIDTSLATPIVPTKDRSTEVLRKNSDQGVVSKSSAPADEVLRIPRSKIEWLLETFGEQVILQSTLEQARIDLTGNQEVISKTIAQMSKLAFKLQDHVLSLTMVNLQGLFSKIERAARDVSKSLKKEIHFIGSGSDLELDKTIVDTLTAPLIHMIRNSVDHGIENVEQRIAANKSIEGNIKLSAQRVGGQFLIELEDDGGGLSRSRILKKALESHLITEDKINLLSDEQVFQLIFENGFSTKDEATDISGRGVGMNVVKETIEALRGQIEISSKEGLGTKFTLRLPLTLSIFNAAITKIGDSQFVIPASDFDEITELTISDIKSFDNEEISVVQMKDRVYEVQDLRKRFRSSNVAKNDKKVISIIKSLPSGRSVAFIVDEIVTMSKVVHKPVGDNVKASRGVSGGTILGDGSVGLILSLKDLCPDSTKKKVA